MFLNFRFNFFQFFQIDWHDKIALGANFRHFPISKIWKKTKIEILKFSKNDIEEAGESMQGHVADADWVNPWTDTFIYSGTARFR